MNHFKRTLKNTMTKGETIFGILWVLLSQYPIPLALSWLLWLLRIPVSNMAFNSILFGLNFVVTVTVFRKYLAKNLRHFGRNIGHCISIAVIGFMVYWALDTLLGILIALFYQSFVNANNANVGSMVAVNYPLMFLNTVILVPIAEEIMYRGIVFGVFDRYNRVVAYVISVLVFSAIHVVGYIGSDLDLVWFLVSLMQYIIPSICLAWTYAETDTIFAPLLIHTAVNLMAMLSMR